jgi:hypothetical protein
MLGYIVVLLGNLVIVWAAARSRVVVKPSPHKKSAQVPLLAKIGIAGYRAARHPTYDTLISALSPSQALA